VERNGIQVLTRPCGGTSAAPPASVLVTAPIALSGDVCRGSEAMSLITRTRAALLGSGVAVSPGFLAINPITTVSMRDEMKGTKLKKENFLIK
jgi:hypothetical protein